MSLKMCVPAYFLGILFGEICHFMVNSPQLAARSFSFEAKGGFRGERRIACLKTDTQILDETFINSKDIIIFHCNPF